MSLSRTVSEIFNVE